MPKYLERGSSTAVSTNVNYRLGKLLKLGLLHGTWLDCGCADGGYTSALAALGVQHTVGIDVEVQRVQSAQHAKKSGFKVDYSCSVSETLPFSDSAFDGVLLNEVLEHVADEYLTLKEVYRVLHPGGVLALISPNRWFPFEGHGMKVWGRSVPFPVPILPWLPSKITQNFTCARNYWPHELRDIVLSAGLEVSMMCSIMPIFEVYPWLPETVIKWYRKATPAIEKTPVIRRFGVSTLVLAQRPARSTD